MQFVIEVDDLFWKKHHFTKPLNDYRVTSHCDRSKIQYFAKEFFLFQLKSDKISFDWKWNSLCTPVKSWALNTLIEKLVLFHCKDKFSSLDWFYGIKWFCPIFLRVKKVAEILLIEDLFVLVKLIEVINWWIQLRANIFVQTNDPLTWVKTFILPRGWQK